MKLKERFTSLLLLVIIIPYLYLAVIYKNLPQQVPTHFGLNGQPNDWGNKASLWLYISFTSVLSILLFLLMRFLPKIDPKRKVKYSASAFTKIGIAVVLLLTVINCLVISSSQKGTLAFTNIFIVLLGAFFAFMGNIMHSLKPNYFAGIRTPWTLESEETWRRTHQYAGKLWFWGGIIIAVLGLLLPLLIALYAFIPIILILCVLPIVYSYRYFKSLEKTNLSNINK